MRFLWDSIEQASIDFTEAQKRYDRAEKEFVDAKLNLHHWAERKKELLTDHLCAIIEQACEADHCQDLYLIPNAQSF